MRLTPPRGFFNRSFAGKSRWKNGLDLRENGLMAQRRTHSVVDVLRRIAL